MLYFALRGRYVGALITLALLACAGCEGTSPLVPPTATPVDTTLNKDRASRDVAATPPRGAEIGKFRFTMYYVAVEGRPKKGRQESAMLASVSATPDILSGPPDKVTIYHKKDCAPIAEIDREFARTLDIQGTGKLADGRVVNTSGVCRCPNSPCFFEIKSAWAIGARGRLAPFRSVAIDTRIVPLGSLLYIPELDGVRMPGKAPWGGYIHDGCVLADDRGGGIRGRELDLFVAKKPYVNMLYRRTKLTKVTVYDGRGWCQKKDGRVRKVPGRT